MPFSLTLHYNCSLKHCGVMKFWQTCPLVSGVEITGQT